MRVLCILASLVLLIGITPSGVFAEEDFAATLDSAKKLKEEGKYAKALNEIGWASKQLQKLHAEKLQTFLPEKVEGLEQQTKNSNAAMGLVGIERLYKSKSGGRVKLTLTGSSISGGAAAQGMGALAGFAQMAAMMDNQPGTEVVRVHGKRAQLKEKNGRQKILLTLNGGAILQVEQTSGDVSKDQLVALANAVDVPGLEAYTAP